MPIPLAATALVCAAVFVCLAVSSCGGEKHGRTNPILTVEEGDSEIRFIQEAALVRLSEFVRRMQSPASDEYDFMVKYPIKAIEASGFGYEYVWIKDISFKDGRYYGVVASGPFYNDVYSLGSRIEFYMDDIADWMYSKGNRIEGGASIKYLIEKIPPHERTEELNAWLKRFR